MRILDFNENPKIKFGSKRPDLVLLSYTNEQNKLFVKEKFDETKSDNKLLGCVLGLAVGDILGCPVEGMSYFDIQKRYKKVENLLYPDYWRNWRLAGLHSDDTQQALAILEAMKKAEKYKKTPKKYSAQTALELSEIFINGMKKNTNSIFGCWRGTGKGFRQVIENLENNKKSRKYPFAFGSPSAGIGAAMRIAPIGILIDEKYLMDFVVKISLITHSDPLGIISAYVIALATKLIQEGTTTFNPNEFLVKLHEKTEYLEDNFSKILGDNKKNIINTNFPQLNSKLIQHLQKIYNEPVNIVINSIEDETRKITNKDIKPTSGYGPTGVIASLYFFLNNYKEPKKSLLTAINAGGDTDTIGAIVGALFGAFYGENIYKEFLPDLFALDLIYNKVISMQQEVQYIDLIKQEGLYTATEDTLKNTLSILTK